jgi:hypothetical protein
MEEIEERRNVGIQLILSSEKNKLTSSQSSKRDRVVEDDEDSLYSEVFIELY